MGRTKARIKSSSPGRLPPNLIPHPKDDPALRALHDRFEQFLEREAAARSGPTWRQRVWQALDDWRRATRVRTEGPVVHNEGPGREELRGRLKAITDACQALEQEIGRSEPLLGDAGERRRAAALVTELRAIFKGAIDSRQAIPDPPAGKGAAGPGQPSDAFWKTCRQILQQDAELNADMLAAFVTKDVWGRLSDAERLALFGETICRAPLGASTRLVIDRLHPRKGRERRHPPTRGKRRRGV
jgi:hypothetical protein